MEIWLDIDSDVVIDEFITLGERVTFTVIGTVLELSAQPDPGQFGTTHHQIPTAPTRRKHARVLIDTIQRQT